MNRELSKALTTLLLSQAAENIGDRDAFHDDLTSIAIDGDTAIRNALKNVAHRYDLLDVALAIANIREELLQGFVPDFRRDNYRRTLANLEDLLALQVDDHVENNRPGLPREYVNAYFERVTGITVASITDTADHSPYIALPADLTTDSVVGEACAQVIDAAKLLADSCLDSKPVDWSEIYGQCRVYYYS